jgi:hypothetical protein
MKSFFIALIDLIQRLTQGALQFPLIYPMRRLTVYGILLVSGLSFNARALTPFPNPPPLLDEFINLTELLPPPEQMLECEGYDQPLSINNRQVIHWKRTTANQYRDRAHVQGPIVSILKWKGDHAHLAVQIGKSKEDAIEIIYNQEFGRLEDPELGWIIQACGDYITSRSASGPYPASPLGALIHWVHANPKGRGHQNGFLYMNGKLFGQNLENVKPRENVRFDVNRLCN